LGATSALLGKRSTSISITGSTSVPVRACAKSFRDYSGLLSRYVRSRLGARPLGELSPAEIQALYSDMLNRKLSACTIRYTHAVLVSALRQAARWKLLLTNPAENVDLPRQSRRHFTVFDVEQTKQFIAAIAGHEYETLFALAITTGMRPSEYLALTWSDFDLERGTVTVSKTLERRTTGAGRRCSNTPFIRHLPGQQKSTAPIAAEKALTQNTTEKRSAPNELNKWVAENFSASEVGRHEHYGDIRDAVT
jgi:integrase